MISSMIFPGRYIQGYQAIKRLGTEIQRLGKSGFLICGTTVYNHILPAFREELEQEVEVTAEKFGTECSDEEIERHRTLAEKAGSGVIVGIGGGKVIDTAKAVAKIIEVPMISVPTVAGNDAPCSALSVIYTPDGVYSRLMYHSRNPDTILVDTRIIAEAPVRFLVAGMGDALSTWFEAESCKQKYAVNMTFTGDIGTMTGYALSRLCYDSLLEYGVSAKKACEARIVTPALEHIIETNTLLSGLGFENCGIAGAHGFQVGFTVLKETHQYLHGEVVAFGTLASMFLTDKPPGIVDEVYTFCESVGLPTTLAEIGLPALSETDLFKVVIATMDKDNSTIKEPVPLTEDNVMNAIKAADNEGRLRKKKI